MLRANNAYRSLFWRLIESLELLSVLTQYHQHKSSLNRANSVTQEIVTLQRLPKSNNNWGSASRLPTDSRVPKSSSIPSRLKEENQPKLKKKIVSESSLKERKIEDNNSILQRAILNRGINFCFFLRIFY